jgi:ubiquinone biosynthesis protein UbiJ
MILEEIIGFWINTITPQMALEELDDKLITLRVDVPNIEKNLYFHDQRIEFNHPLDKTPDLIITGDIYTLLQFLGGNDRAKVTLEGDLSIAVSLQQLIQTTNIDCQEWLSQATSRFLPDPIFANNPFQRKTNYDDLLKKMYELEQRIKDLEHKLS